MTLVAIGSVKGSPGATTAAVAFGACWPADRRVVVVEADPAGGDVAARFGLAPEPGLVSLASATRRSATPDALWAHTQELPGRLAVVVGPASAKQSRAALAMLVPAVIARWGELNADVLVDCGRLDPSSPCLDLLAQSDLAIVVVRPGLAELHHLASRVADLRSRCVLLTVVLSGAGPYGAGEVSDAVGAEVVGVIPWDPSGASLLAGTPGSARGLGRTPLMRAARQIVGQLAQPISPPIATEATHATVASGNGAPSPVVSR
jgi:MinD-like ATPase involved in chromosome partitioning or flagellar assembly